MFKLTHGIIAAAAILLGFIFYSTFKKTEEAFATAPSISPDVDPRAMFDALRGLIDKFDRPELWDTTKRMAGKTHGEMARINLGIIQ
jgi:hypothetical protein